jgi:hypothetical protein
VALRKRARSSEKCASRRILGPKTKRRGKERNIAKQRTNGVDDQVMDEGTVEQVWFGVYKFLYGDVFLIKMNKN